MEYAMRPPVEFPEMRDQVIASLQSLADPSHQEVRWGRYEEGVSYFDDLTLNVHVLYDDCQVLPDPSRSVGAVLYEDEVQALRGLNAALGPMLDDLRDSPDSDYLADPRWPQVVDAARAALDVMRSSV
jgi:hypothetical protein